MPAARLPTFWTKAALAAGLVALADGLLFRSEGPGANLGVFALAWTAAAVVATPAVRRDPLGRWALLAAVFLGALQIERPTLVGWLMFGIALGVAAMAPRAGRADDAWRWAQRIVVQGLKGVLGPLLDLRRLTGPKLRRRGPHLRVAALSAVLPVVGGLVFLALFAVANPMIEQALPALELPGFDPGRTFFLGVVLLAVWGILRPRFLRRPRRLPEASGDLDLPGVTPTSITASLAVFNAVFALQNGLDLAFLWSGASLPDGMTYAEYAHRGAYPLIVTALLAGLFVVVFLRPGSATAGSPLVRRLVALWVAQNLFLVASTILRTLAYVDAYSLTALRLAALAWMGLVAVGLGLIGYRLLRGRSASWLVDANVAAAGLVLAGCAVVDLSAVAASWNVRHAREVGGRGAPLDVCYLLGQGEPALVSLVELERRPIPYELRRRVHGGRVAMQERVRGRQSDWRTWTFRAARRLAQAERLAAGVPAVPAADVLGCDGLPVRPLRVPPVDG